MYKYRFLDITFTLTSTIKKISVAVVFIAIFYASYQVINITLTDLPEITKYIVSIIMSFIGSFRAMKYFHAGTSVITRFINYNPLASLEEVTENIQHKLNHCTSIQAIQKELKIIFHRNLKINEAFIISLDENKKSIQYTELQKYFEINTDFLVTEEVLFKTETENQKFPYTKELKNLGEICYPLYKDERPKDLIGMLVIGKKANRSIYSSNELDLIQNMSSKIEKVFYRIRYNEENRIQTEYATQTLEKHNQLITDLLRQQTAFIKANEREYQRLLSLAKQKIEKAFKNKDISPTVKKDINAVTAELNKIENIIQTNGLHITISVNKKLAVNE